MTKGHFDTLDFPIARGKEAHVFHGTSENGPVAVKIFHTSNAVFKNLMQYIEGDQRFGGLSRRHRNLVDIWVRKEYRNLLRLAKWGLRVPEPIAVQKNVLVMEYIGDEISPAPRLRDTEIENPEEVFDYLIRFTATAWQKANLVHGDLSAYNILWHEGEAVVIDVGQGVVQNHPKSEEFLVRDVKQLVRWANRNGIDVELAEAMYDVLEMDLDEEE
jgi:RIO kinase 1